MYINTAVLFVFGPYRLLIAIGLQALPNSSCAIFAYTDFANDAPAKLYLLLKLWEGMYNLNREQNIRTNVLSHLGVR